MLSIGAIVVVRVAEAQRDEQRKREDYHVTPKLRPDSNSNPNPRPIPVPNRNHSNACNVSQRVKVQP